MFASLQFRNFRGFTDLTLTNLQQVNLVVGRNNAGKTSLLEGIALLANPKGIEQIPSLLRPVSAKSRNNLKWLFRGEASHSELKLAGTANNNSQFELICRKLPAVLPPGTNRSTSSAGYSIIHTGMMEVRFPLHQPETNCHNVSVHHHSPESLVRVFANAVKRKGGEERIERLLCEVDPRIQKVRLYPTESELEILVDIGLPEALPVSQVGQGIYRLIAIFSELIGENPQICIIDEIENGIHHSMLEQVWAGIGAAANDLNVQVFATTHSQECIEAAHTAFSKREKYDFGIVQLFRIEEGVQGRVLDRKHIEAAIAGEIDLR